MKRVANQERGEAASAHVKTSYSPCLHLPSSYLKLKLALLILLPCAAHFAAHSVRRAMKTRMVADLQARSARVPGPVEEPLTRPLPNLGSIKGVLFDIDGANQGHVPWNKEAQRVTLACRASPSDDWRTNTTVFDDGPIMLQGPSPTRTRCISECSARCFRSMASMMECQSTSRSSGPTLLVATIQLSWPTAFQPGQRLSAFDSQRRRKRSSGRLLVMLAASLCSDIHGGGIASSRFP